MASGNPMSTAAANNDGGGMTSRGSGSKPVSPRTGVSSAELLTLLRHPAAGVSGKDSVRGREGLGDAFGGLDAEFSRLYLGSPVSPADSRSNPTTGIAGQDNFGMTGLADLVSQALQGRLGPVPFGLDLRASGLKMEQSESLSRSFVSPWFDASLPLAAGGVSPGHLASVLPACYNVQPSPPVASKIPAFADETLFYMFYAMPGDRMQELAARELFARQWRFHKELKVWLLLVDEGQLAAMQRQMISPDMSSLASTKQPKGKAQPLSAPSASGAEPVRAYTVFDPQSWTKITKELPVRLDQLEDRFSGGSTAPAKAGTAPAAPAATPVLFNVNRSIL